jgi:hypothetical protein
LPISHEIDRRVPDDELMSMRISVHGDARENELAEPADVEVVPFLPARVPVAGSAAGVRSATEV